jgi:hypothetical protein
MIKMNYEHKATLYAEKHGIVDFEIKGKIMIYKESFPTEGVYEARVDLTTMKEKRRRV